MTPGARPQQPPLPSPLALVRPDLLDFTGYSSSRTSYAATAREASDPEPSIWLNANESGTAHPADPEGRSRRYPEPQPVELVSALATTYGVHVDQVVAGRGSDELIDILVRTMCRPGQDGVVISSPTFGMYAVSASLHGVPVTDVPAADLGSSWAVDVDAVAAATRSAGARLVFLANPGNPTGSVVPPADLARLAEAIAYQAVLVVDEAYAEYSNGPSAVTMLADHPTLVVLRTLSKAHGLAAARVGCALADPGLTALLRAVLPPYPLAAPAVGLAVAALDPSHAPEVARATAAVLADRDRLRAALQADPRVRTTYGSETNFVLVRCTDADDLLTSLRAAGIVVRDMRHLPGLDDALRVTVGAPAEVDAVVERLKAPDEDGRAPSVRTR